MSMVVYHLHGETTSLSIYANGQYSVNMPGGEFCSDWPFTCTIKEKTIYRNLPYNLHSDKISKLFRLMVNNHCPIKIFHPYPIQDWTEVENL